MADHIDHQLSATVAHRVPWTRVGLDCNVVMVECLNGWLIEAES